MATANERQAREPDLPLAFARQRTLPPPAGYTELEAVLDEPRSDKDAASLNRQIPVFQWEIDPTDPERRCGSAKLKHLGWDFRMWWERHPAGLVYASIQATRGRREEDWQDARVSPLDRALAVNLVYDKQRQGILSIHGSVQNFRPFIEAFLMGFGVTPSF